MLHAVAGSPSTASGARSGFSSGVSPCGSKSRAVVPSIGVSGSALGLGLLNGVAASGELPAAAAALSAELASRDPRALGACKPFLAEMEWLPPNQRAARGIEAGVEFFSRAHGAASSSANNDENGGKETR